MAPKRILVAQMTRMGDVLQTSPLIRAIRAREPDAHIAVLVRRMGKAIAESNPDINDIIVYEEDDIYLELKADDAIRLLKVYAQMDEYIRHLREQHFDIAYNCTHSLCSAMLLKLAQIPEVIGAHLSEDWRYVWRGRGPNYFITSVLHRDANDLNLCDSFRYFMRNPPAASGLALDIDRRAQAEAMSILSEHGIRERDFLVCFQLGASDADKRWPESQFASLARKLVAERNARIVLLGVSEESPLGGEFERHAPGIATQLFGKTTISQLAAILQRARVLVTNDTGTMHIAAAVRCPIVLVSVGYVHFRETGPYGAGHCAVEMARESTGRSDMRGRDAGHKHEITAEHVADAIKLALNETTVLSTGSETVQIYRSDFAPDGCLQWFPVQRRPATTMDIIRLAYRPMWLDSFGACNSDATYFTNLARYYAPPIDSECWLLLKDAFTGIAEIAGRGAAVTSTLLETLKAGGAMKEARQIVSSLMAIDDELRIFGELNPAVKPLVATARFERDNLEGADPSLLANHTLEIYRSLAARAEAVASKLALLQPAISH